ncbi:MAG: hypothetical protein ACWA40_05985 [Planktomarina sp.]
MSQKPMYHGSKMASGMVLSGIAGAASVLSISFSTSGIIIASVVGAVSAFVFHLLTNDIRSEED